MDVVVDLDIKVLTEEGTVNSGCAPDEGVVDSMLVVDIVAFVAEHLMIIFMFIIITLSILGYNHLRSHPIKRDKYAPSCGRERKN